MCDLACDDGGDGFSPEEKCSLCKCKLCAFCAPPTLTVVAMPLANCRVFFDVGPDECDMEGISGISHCPKWSPTEPSSTGAAIGYYPIVSPSGMDVTSLKAPLALRPDDTATDWSLGHGPAG